MDAFWKLSTCRQIFEGGCGPIPWNVIHQYAVTSGFAEDDIEWIAFETAILGLDHTFLEHQRDESKKRTQAAKREGRMNKPSRGRGGRVG